MFNKCCKSGTTGAVIRKTFSTVIVVYLIRSANNPWWHDFCESRCPLPHDVKIIQIMYHYHSSAVHVSVSLCLGLRWCEVSSGYVPQTHQPSHWSPHHSVSDGQPFTPGGSGPCSAGQDQGRAVLLRWLWRQKGVWTALVLPASMLMLLNLSVYFKDPYYPIIALAEFLSVHQENKPIITVDL